MSGDIFDLDEEREQAQKTADQSNTGPAQSSSSSTSPSSQNVSSSSGLLRPPAATTTAPLLSPLPQPFAQALPQHRKHASSFAATPSFPSPLAQAITVPPQSDTSSSSSRSSTSSDDEAEGRSKRSAGSRSSRTPRLGAEGAEPRARTTSPRTKEGSASPASTEKSLSRPASPARPQTVSPSAMMVKGRRTDHGRDLAPISTGSAGSSPRTSPTTTSRRSSPTHTRRLTDASREHPPMLLAHARRRSGSYSSGLQAPMSSSSQAGSSPLAFGSPELEPIDDESMPRSSRDSTSSPQESARDSPNILGLGLGANWDAASTTSGSSRSGSLKGKSKEGPPPSPRRERDRTSMSGMPISSPPRQRRPSEFLNPSSLDTRKMPLVGGRNSNTIPTLSSSASMISPLNPLPSPWTSGSDSSSAFSPAASETSATTPSSNSGAIRLNRVPTSVRLAAELIKNPNAAAMSPPQQNLSLQPSAPPTGDNSLATSPSATTSAEAAQKPAASGVSTARELAAFSSMPPPSLPHTKPPFNIGKGRPTLSVPATPSSTRNPSFADKSMGLSTDPAASGSRTTSSSNTAPPTSYKPPAGTAAQPPRLRPSAPPASSSSQPDVFPSTAKAHRYRTSMHEPSFKAGFASKAEPTVWSSADASGNSTPGGGASTPGLGLGFGMPQTALRVQETTSAQPIAKMDPSNLPRLRSVTGQGLAMDLAGISSIGDAASHASMIMQSRQAKLQRWRPTSAGGPSGSGERPLPPAFNRSTTTGAPAMLAAPRTGRQAQWDLQPKIGPASAASSPGEDLPPVPMTMPFLSEPQSAIAERGATAHNFASGVSGPMAHSNAGPDRMLSPAALGGQLMARTGSATAQIGGVEWIDWMDEYKRYKEVKIRADAEAARLKAQSDMPPPPVPAAASTSTSPREEQTAENSPVSSAADARRMPAEIDLTSSIVDTSSAVDLTRSDSRDDFGPSGHLRKRSMSIRSQLSALDPTRSPSQKRMSMFERPRNTSSGSTKSDAASITAGGKKKKNLVTKMEGWWSAVKSNFVPETGAPHQSHRPSNLGIYAERRIPSAPASRRSSGKSVLAVDSGLLPPAMTRRDTSQSLRNATSHAELRSPTTARDPAALEPALSITGSTSADLAKLTRSAMTLDVPGPHSELLAPVPLAAPRASLESRRRQPNLRLELEPHVLTQPSSGSRAQSSNGSISALPARLSTVNSSQSDSRRPSEHTSRSSSYGQSFMGPGLTPGVQRWDQSPSPIFAVTTADSGGSNESKPVAPGAEISVASVRRHVKHRLNGAKETCDNTLRKVIALITRFADETRAQDEMAMEEKRRLEEQRDYFENISDSPLFDDGESDFEGGLGFDGSRSRNVSSSRGPSRRPSISRPSVASSPSRRASIIPGSPNRTRRRPSAVPRSYVSRDRINRSVGLSHDRTQSATSSRSTSRSRSPMPMIARTLPSTIDVDEDLEADRQFLASLQELIVIATDVLESSVNSLLSKPSACTEIIQKLQRVGQNWDEHDNWPGRDWYVEILMAVASLRRVLDWWETEKGFWAFEDEDDNEPLLFILKPREESRFDQEFKAHNDRAISPIRALPEPPTSASDHDVPTPGSSSGPMTAKNTQHDAGPDTAKARGVEDLKFMAEQARMINIVMELGLQGEEIQYVNDAILEVTGQDPDDVLGKPINDLLAPADANSFAEATQKLLEDDNNTVQMRVRIEVSDLDNDTKGEHQPGPLYVEVEGVGMLMREDDEPSHTMWVLKPVTAIQRDSELPADAAFPVERILSNEGVLCRICEREIVSWFFEKHNETCDAVHRLEAEISNCNECLKELCQTIAKLRSEIENVRATDSPNLQSVLFYTLPECLLDTSEAPVGPQGVESRKVGRAVLADLVDILKTAELIETPSVREVEADLDFNVQRYLPPDSEDRLAAIMRWQRPHDVDRSLSVLVQHVESQLRRKHKAIARMQSTIRYSEKTRHEWEDKINRLLEEMSDGSASDSGSSPTEGPSMTLEVPSGPDISPPTRKIAPQARLPITVGHPQRPTSSHAAASFGHTVPPPPLIAGVASDSRPKLPSAPPTAALIAPPRPEPVKRSQSTHSKRQSPLQIPADRMSHARRVSTSRAFMTAPLSPRIPSAAFQPRAQPPSIKDFEIIKPISRGAFGSVYLAKKVATGDYYAIKALKKSDMIAKNQITNVKAERTILMNQSSSPYVAKLFFSFQSKEYLYLVMEYLNGGDCATLVKTLGGLPEEWARSYIAEVVLGLEYLHVRNIVHRDIKPDNLLIDARGHLKLTDFGLSKIGLLNRQVGGPRPAYLRGTSLRSSRRPPSSSRPAGGRIPSGSSGDSPLLSPEMLPQPVPSSLGQSYFAQHETGSADESSGSESMSGVADIMRQMSIANNATSEAGTPSVTGDGVRNVPRFVGTPDYLAPESILGIGTDDRMVDWWALGVVLYEFLYGFPPFHDESPEKVFDNVVSRRINWHDDEIEISAEARDLMDRLMGYDPMQRLGSRGADEVKKHAFFAGIDWSAVTTSEASFVPEVTDPESTDYFDARGAINQFQDDDAVPQVLKQKKAAADDMSAVMDDIAGQDDFGTFEFRNLPVLKQANDDVIKKLRRDSLAPIGQTLDIGALKDRARSVSAHGGKPRKVSKKYSDPLRPPSPATSNSSLTSAPSRPLTPLGSAGAGSSNQHSRKPSEMNALDRVKSSDEADLARRNSAPSRVRAGSDSKQLSVDSSTSMGMWRQRRQASMNTEILSAPGREGDLRDTATPGDDSAIESEPPSRRGSDRALDVLIAEDNPISQKILETLLTRMGCRCICVEDGSQALASTMGSIRFDVIICDIHMPVVSGEQVARMIRSTNNHNQNTPIIAATSYEQSEVITEEGTLFSAVLNKPVTKAALVQALAKLGFELASAGGDEMTAQHARKASQSQSQPGA